MEDYPQAKHEDDAKKRHEEIKCNPDLLQCAKDQSAFLNVFFGRMWHDLHNNKAFIEYLREKLTRKLLKVKVNFFIQPMFILKRPKTPKNVPLMYKFRL